MRRIAIYLYSELDEDIQAEVLERFTRYSPNDKNIKDVVESLEYFEDGLVF